MIMYFIMCAIIIIVFWAVALSYTKDDDGVRVLKHNTRYKGPKPKPYPTKKGNV